MRTSKRVKVAVVTNMYPTEFDKSQGTFVEQQVKGLREIGVEIGVLHLDRQRLGRCVYRQTGARLREFIKTYRPDLVHVMYGGILADRATKASGSIPTIVSYCGSDLLGDAVGPWYRRWTIGAYRIRASHAAAHRSTGIVVKSERLRAALPASVDRRKVWVLPNGIDLTRFRPMDMQDCRRRLGWRDTDDRLQVLFPNGKGDPRKRLELAESAVRKTNESGTPVTLHVLPRVAHEEVPVWLNAADVVILTSIHEGSPNIVKEALSCDRPVVSVDVGDVPERIGGVKGCHLVDSTPESIAEGLRQVYLGPRHVEGRRAVESLSLAKVGERLARIYEDILVRAYGAPADTKHQHSVAVSVGGQSR